MVRFKRTLVPLIIDTLFLSHLVKVAFSQKSFYISGHFCLKIKSVLTISKQVVNFHTDLIFDQKGQGFWDVVAFTSIAYLQTKICMFVMIQSKKKKTQTVIWHTCKFVYFVMFYSPCMASAWTLLFFDLIAAPPGRNVKRRIVSKVILIEFSFDIQLIGSISGKSENFHP